MRSISLFLIILFLHSFHLSAQSPSRSGWQPSSFHDPAELRFFPCEGDSLYEQGFDDGIPAGWLIHDFDSLAPKSYIDTIIGPGWQLIQDYRNPSNIAMASPSWYENTGQSDDWLITDTLKPGSNSCFSWFAYSQDKYFPESYELLVSNTIQDTAAFFANEPLLVVDEEGYDVNYRSVNLSAYAGQKIFLAFRHTSFDQFILVLDDLRMTNVQMQDIGAVEILPVNADTMQGVNIEAAVRNYGSDTLVADSALEVWYAIDGGTPNKMVLRDSIVLAPNDTLQFVHDSLWVPAENRAYHLCIWTGGFTDMNVLNDTTCVWVGIGTATSVQNSLKEEDFRTYPNPVTDMLRIELPADAASSSWNLRLLDIFGRTHWQTAIQGNAPSPLSVSVSHLTPGLYFLHIGHPDKGRLVYRIVKQ